MSEILARPSLVRTTEERQEECARKAAWDWKKKNKLKAEGKATFYSLVER